MRPQQKCSPHVLSYISQQVEYIMRIVSMSCEMWRGFEKHKAFGHVIELQALGPRLNTQWKGKQPNEVYLLSCSKNHDPIHKQRETLVRFFHWTLELGLRIYVSPIGRACTAVRPKSSEALLLAREDAFVITTKFCHPVSAHMPKMACRFHATRQYKCARLRLRA